MRGHTSYVYCLAVNPQGTIIVSGSFDETIVFWDVQKGALFPVLDLYQFPI